MSPIKHFLCFEYEIRYGGVLDEVQQTNKILYSNQFPISYYNNFNCIFTLNLKLIVFNYYIISKIDSIYIANPSIYIYIYI